MTEENNRAAGRESVGFGEISDVSTESYTSRRNQFGARDVFALLVNITRFCSQIFKEELTLKLSYLNLLV
jgi:hypothetical protein